LTSRFQSLQLNGYFAVDADLTPKRPWRVTIFSLLVLLLGSGLNLARAIWALRQAEALADVPATYISVGPGREQTILR